MNFGNIRFAYPIIQAGMGGGVALSRLASAVSTAGGLGSIGASGLDGIDGLSGLDVLRRELHKMRELTDKPFAVNIMEATPDSYDLLNLVLKERVQILMVSAGLWLDLPRLVGDADIKIIPILSSLRAFKLIVKKWVGNYGRYPDGVIISGPDSGGHIGLSFDDIVANKTPNLDSITTEFVEYCSTLTYPVPVIASGGIANHEQISNLMRNGAHGVQIGTRFVCTEECEASDDFKKLYISSTEKDLIVINSVTGMPARVINNSFIAKLKNGNLEGVDCDHTCLRTCLNEKKKYCLRIAIRNAVAVNSDAGIVFAGRGIASCEAVVSVVDLIKQLIPDNRIP